MMKAFSAMGSAWDQAVQCRQVRRRSSLRQDLTALIRDITDPSIRALSTLAEDSAQRAGEFEAFEFAGALHHEDFLGRPV
jgi:hypothetical protein